MTPSTLAIVCTVRDPSPSFLTWIEHHRQLVDRLYIYLDSPSEAAVTAIPTGPAICTFAGTACSHFSGPSGVMQRQCQNVLDALMQCANDGIDWLIHIDSDEMIFSPTSNLKSYFSRVDPAVSCIRFINHEVVSAYAAENPFKELNVFKKNQFFNTVLGVSGGEEKVYFLGYTIGKSAVRVNQCVGPSGPHDFEVSGGQTIREEEICILHYLSATYKEWLKKFSELGDFQPFWFDDAQRPMHRSFLVESRNIFLESLRLGDWNRARDFYLSHLLSASDIKRLLEKGDLLFVDLFLKNTPLAVLEKQI